LHPDERDRALNRMTEFFGSFTLSYAHLDDPHEANYSELDGAPLVKDERFLFKQQTYKVVLIMEGVKKGDTRKCRFLWPGKAVLVSWLNEPGARGDVSEVPVEVCLVSFCM
jgi:hypothetical protein